MLALSALRVLFHPTETPRKILLLALFYRWGKWGSQGSTFPQSYDWEVVEVGLKSRSDCKFLASTIVWHRLDRWDGRGEGLFWKSCHMSISASFLQSHRAWHQEKWDPGAMALSTATAVVVTQQGLLRRGGSKLGVGRSTLRPLWCFEMLPPSFCFLISHTLVNKW